MLIFSPISLIFLNIEPFDHVLVGCFLTCRLKTTIFNNISMRSSLVFAIFCHFSENDVCKTKPISRFGSFLTCRLKTTRVLTYVVRIKIILRKCLKMDKGKHLETIHFSFLFSRKIVKNRHRREKKTEATPFS